METENGVEAAPRYVETMPTARASDLQVALGRRARQHAGIHGRRGPDFRDGRQPRRFADSRIAPAAGGVGFVPVENLVGRVDAIIGSWDPAVRHDPLWTWPSGLRFSRFFSRVN